MKERYEELERKYKIKKNGINTVIEELNQQPLTKTAELKRYEERLNQYKINRMFVQNQDRIYKQMGGIRGVNREKLSVKELSVKENFEVTYGIMRKNIKEMQNG